MPHASSPRICLVAGVPRSGSTWAFNAARRLLELSGTALQAAWIADYRPEDPAPVHLVKAHKPEEVTFTPDIVLTTRRRPEACLASLIRMGWLKNEPEAIRRSWAWHHRLYAHWQARSDLEIAYGEITGAPEAALDRLAAVLDLSLPPGATAAVAAELAALQAPGTGHYDPVTLLHPGHRGGRQQGAVTPAAILQIVDGLARPGELPEV